MLKVKDGIKLEELEKYGFEKDEYQQYQIKDLDIFIGTDEDDRELVLDFGFNNENINVLYDLITAGIVVKE